MSQVVESKKLPLPIAVYQDFEMYKGPGEDNFCERIANDAGMICFGLSHQGLSIPTALLCSMRGITRHEVVYDEALRTTTIDLTNIGLKLAINTDGKLDVLGQGGSRKIILINPYGHKPVKPGRFEEPLDPIAPLKVKINYSVMSFYVFALLTDFQTNIVHVARMIKTNDFEKTASYPLANAIHESLRG